MGEAEGSIENEFDFLFSAMGLCGGCWSLLQLEDDPRGNGELSEHIGRERNCNGKRAQERKVENQNERDIR